jgi:hypothetical protein
MLFQKSARLEKGFKNYKDENPLGDFVGVITVEVPEGIPLKPLKKKIDELVKEEEARWVLFERAIEELDLSESDLEDLEKVRENVWKDEKKKLGL